MLVVMYVVTPRCCIIGEPKTFSFSFLRDYCDPENLSGEVIGLVYSLISYSGDLFHGGTRKFQYRKRS